MPVLGDRLKERRNRLGLTQEELAHQLGMGVRQIHRYESGTNDPSSEVVVKLAQFLNVTTDYLLGLTDDPHGEITFSDLSETEQQLIIALRDGSFAEALEAQAALMKNNKQSDISGLKPAPNG
jgi:transcriptional regulator with XRE-family HTH domain